MAYTYFFVKRAFTSSTSIYYALHVTYVSFRFYFESFNYCHPYTENIIHIGGGGVVCLINTLREIETLKLRFIMR